MLSSQKMMSAPSGGAADDYFKNVTLLLNGNGTNGAQNNTFVDSSTNNFTITRNGNATQGSFSPYGSLWSNYFVSNAYLKVNHNSVFNLGSSDFCIECFVNISTMPANLILGKESEYWLNYSRTDLGTTSNKLGFSISSSSGWFAVSSTTTPVVGTWYHIAAVRSGSTLSLYVNGVREGSISIPAGTFDTYSEPFNIGAWDTDPSASVNGYISNVRFVKNSSVYSGTTITVPTTPLTAITNTQLLTCQSNRFIDNSSNNFTVSPTGSVSVQRFSPFNPTTSYTTATIGGSGYFDGTGDSLNTGTTGVNDTLTGDFTIEAWVYPTVWGNYQRIVSGGVGASLPDWTLGFSTTWNGTLQINWFLPGNDMFSTAYPSATLNTWYHVAVVRTGSTIYYYINGVQYGTTAFSTNPGSVNGGFTIADRSDADEYWYGYISDVRVVVGTNVYGTGSTCTIPTAPLTAITNTRLLCNFTNAGIPDSAMMNDLETAGNAQVSTSVKKYGTGSIYKTNATDANYLVTQNISTLKFAGDFTIEMWLYPLSWDDATLITFASGTGRFQMGCDGSNFGLAASGVAWYLSYGTKPSLNTWTHIAITRSGSTLRMFYDGVQVQSATTSYSFTGFTHIGGYPGAGTNYTYNGYMDDLRITNGYARYTANFTPPTTALPTK
jgi:hypothetical protein